MDNNKNSNTISNPKILSSQKKGKLRIFFGMAEGVGKTYQMLQSAHLTKSDGYDIIIGYIETHERVDIENKILGLELISRKEIFCNSCNYTEINLDAIIERKPQIVIIDELAHTNITGSRHKKRFQDVLELLNCGIDVWATLNVQHIESRVSVVEQITGIKITETVPDFIVEMADKIEIIDILPEDLQKRIRNGKVYEKENIDTALNGFFREGNINSLREIAFQVVAKLVDKSITNYRNEHDITDLWKATEKLLVAVGPSPFSAYLIKWTKKTAFNMNAEWVVVNIENSKSLSKEQKRTLNENINLARQLGAKIVTISDDDIVKGIIRTAKTQNVSQIVIGKPLFFSIENFFQKSITNRLIKESGDIDVYVVSQPGIKEKVKFKRTRKLDFKSLINEFSLILPSLFFITLTGYILEDVISQWGLSLIFLSHIIYISAYYSKIASMTVSILSALVWNYIFIPPRFTFIISKTEDIMVYLVFFIVAIVTSNLSSKLHEKEKFLKKRERRLELLYELSQEIVNNPDFERVMFKLAKYIGNYFNSEAMLFIYDGEQETSNIYPNRDLDINEQEITSWVINNGIAAGKGTDTFSDSEYHFYPINSTNRIEGVIILKVGSKRIAENEEFLRTISFMIGSSIIKEKIVRIRQKTMVEEETDKLYSIILSSISHELKTPVTSIALSASGLCDDKLSSDKFTREVLINDILEANDRLNRIITNLLDMTRIESGRLKLNLQWNDINDLITLASQKYTNELKNYNFIKEINAVLPPIKLDFGLVEQVISNLLYNAIIHTKPGTTIIITAGIENSDIYIEIKDNGGGIQAIDKIFKKFYKERPKKTGGLGIGLSICKAIIEFHKWTLEAHNNDIGGVTFRIIIPFRKGELK
ncbi:MAG: sensor histidine kinase KdpD [Fusobacteriaceae bacterium]|nr:sensor histidine kinase KdpD [Fusobacteriaceae bacterium]MBP6467215.1 sensor histidine kinase KdpD [Fusobacteriaceae bacterium]MBU9918813.1 sensor histidine kinase KdpD [Fusobacteriaceae bacterium]